ncbi:MAG: S-layer homology domain-containing protein [Propioniciclava sp.]|uniref:S-layer homology domain-containing protein n=1 Tax=Propioniciclava sp. TaxID=2038686 RepID=UPI0039E2F823
MLRLLTLLLTAALLLTPALPARATTPLFKDVPYDSQFHYEIEWLASQGVSTGWVVNGDRYYRPRQPIARDAMAAFLYRFAEHPAFTPPAVSPFADLNPSDQFYKEITWVAEYGVATGWSLGNDIQVYRPLDTVRRDAMAAFLFRIDPVITMFGSGPQRGPMPEGFSFVHATRQSEDYWPLSLCRWTYTSFTARSFNARTGGRMVEHGQYGDEGEDHYYAEAALVFPTVAAAQAYMDDVNRASLVCSVETSIGTATTSYPTHSGWDQAVVTLSGNDRGRPPGGTESLMARRGAHVVHVLDRRELAELPISISERTRTTAITLLNRLSA